MRSTVEGDMKDCLKLEQHWQLKLGDKSLEELYVLDEELSVLIAEVEYRCAEKEEFDDNGD